MNRLVSTMTFFPFAEMKLPSAWLEPRRLEV